MKSKRLKIMVSSTVYGIEELLERIYTILTAYGYEVWMSHKGTMPVFSNVSALDNCLNAVESCDLFLGIISTYYGSSGYSENDISFTHKEVKKAIEINKPRWILAHDQVVFARHFLRDLGFITSSDRQKLELKEHATSINDLRVIDMYEDAIMHKTKLHERKGNWVQKYNKDEEALLYATAQFSRYLEVEQFLSENFERYQ